MPGSLPAASSRPRFVSVTQLLLLISRWKRRVRKDNRSILKTWIWGKILRVLPWWRPTRQPRFYRHNDQEGSTGSRNTIVIKWTTLTPIDPSMPKDFKIEPAGSSSVSKRNHKWSWPYQIKWIASRKRRAFRTRKWMSTSTNLPTKWNLILPNRPSDNRLKRRQECHSREIT